MMYTNKPSVGTPNIEMKPKDDKRKSKAVVGNSVEEQEEQLKPKDEKPKVVKESSELVRSESKKKIDEVEELTQSTEDHDKIQDDKKTESDTGDKKDEEPSVTNVVKTAKGMEGKLHHRQNAGGANEALQKGDENIPMNCWDAVLYIVAQAGELKSEVLSDTAKKSDEDYKKFQSGENIELMKQEHEEDQKFNVIMQKSSKLELKIRGLETKLDKLLTGASGYKLLLPVIRKKMANTVTKSLTPLQEELKQLQREREENMNLRKGMTKVRVNKELEVRNRPYKDLLKVDQAWEIMTCRQNMEGGDHDVQTVKGKWPPPAGCTIFLTHDDSKCPDFDHVMLSLGGGKVAHLQSVTPTELGKQGFDVGKLKVVDLMEYMKVAAGTSKEWTVKAGPRCW